MAQRRSIYGISDTLWRQAKSAAASDGSSLSEWIGEAIQQKIADKKQEKSTMTLTELIATAIQYGEYDADDGCINFAAEDDCSKFWLGDKGPRVFLLCIGPDDIADFATPQAIDQAIRDGLLNEVAASDPNNILIEQGVDPR